MTRFFTLNRWNWSQKAEKWVFIELTEKGEKKYRYQLNPPQEFIDLTAELKYSNEKLIKTTDPVENAKIFRNLIELSKKMQEMGKL